MPVAFAVSTTIHATTTAVWATLTDWSKAPAWMPGIETLATGGPTEIGTQIRFTARGAEQLSEIVDCVLGERIVLRSVQGPVTADYRYTLSADGDSTRLDLEASCDISGPMMLAGPFLRVAMRWSDAKQVDALKKLVES